jgi:hypothetical protein
MSSDLSATLEVPSTENAAVSSHPGIDEKDTAVLVDLHDRLVHAKAVYNAAAEDAKSKRKAMEGAREIFESTFQRIVRRDDLPLFNQSELLDRAQSDPVVMKLVDRLLAAGHDVNAILVSGYSQDERAQASAYLDAVDHLTSGEGEHDPVPEPPAFLLPQPLTPVEIADIGKRLADAELNITVEQIASYGKAQIAEVRDWLDRVDAIAKDKGEALTADDLPEPPAFLVEADAANVEADGGEETDEDTNDDAPKVH